MSAFQSKAYPDIAGLGRRLQHESDQMFAMDLDDCVFEGKLNPYAADLVAAARSYSEFSPSGKRHSNLQFFRTGFGGKNRFRSNKQPVGASSRSLTGSLLNWRLLGLGWLADKYEDHVQFSVV